MKAHKFIVTAIALMLTAGAYAQNQPAPATQNQTEVYKVKPRTPEERQAHRAEMKAKLAQMTPAERQAFKQARHEKKQARLNAMTPEQRTQFMDRHQQRKALRQQSK